MDLENFEGIDLEIFDDLQFDSSQSEAIYYDIQKPLMIQAGPGSGKVKIKLLILRQGKP